MKNSKEKAQELVDKFKPYMYPFAAGSAYLSGDREGNKVLKDAKECAIICIDEKISEFKEMGNNIMGLQFDGKIKYWEEVKNEVSNSI